MDVVVFVFVKCVHSIKIIVFPWPYRTFTLHTYTHPCTHMHALWDFYLVNLLNAMYVQCDWMSWCVGFLAAECNACTCVCSNWNSLILLEVTEPFILVLVFETIMYKSINSMVNTFRIVSLMPNWSSMRLRQESSLTRIKHQFYGHYWCDRLNGQRTMSLNKISSCELSCE